MIIQYPPLRAQLWDDSGGPLIFQQYVRVIGYADLSNPSSYLVFVLGDDGILQAVTFPDVYLIFDYPIDGKVSGAFYTEGFKLRTIVGGRPALILSLGTDLEHGLILYEDDGTVAKEINLTGLVVTLLD